MNTSTVSTLTVPPRRWRIKDAVVRLREHGTERVYGLPSPPTACRVGAASELRLDDPSVSREHAELVPVKIDGEQVWKIHDLKSKNGLRCDGEALTRFMLRPGVEIGLGALTLIAESEQLLGLLSLLRRFLGWAIDRQNVVDQALRSLRDWAAQRADLIVVGDGDLTPIARRLHNLVIGAEVSFTSFVPTESRNDAAVIVKAAATGTLCVRQPQRAADAVTLVEHVRETEYIARPQLILCTADAASAATMKKVLERPTVICVPPLASRSDELEELVQVYAKEIADEMRLVGPGLTMHDLEQLCAQQFRSLAEVEDTALRVVVMRTWGMTAGAAKLGLDHSSLHKWAVRKGLNT